MRFGLALARRKRQSRPMPSQPRDLVYAKVRDEGAWQRAREIRHRVYIEEQAIPAELEWDAPDAYAEHRLLLVDGVAVGCSRWRWTSPGVARLERFAVLAAHRGAGHGKTIVRSTLDEALEAGARRVEISAQSYLERFYAGFGFAVTGPEYEEAGLPHLPMAIDVDREGALSADPGP